MGRFSGIFDEILAEKSPGAIPDSMERSFTGEALAGLKAGVAVELPKMIGQAMKAVSDPGGGVYDAGQRLVEGAEERYAEDPAAYAKSAYGEDKSDYNPLKYGYDAASMTPPSLVGAAAAIPVAAFGAPAAVVTGTGMLASGALFGASQYQDTYERAKEAGLSEEEAKAAGRKTGLIEGGGEAVANMIPGSFIAKPFAKLAGKGAARAAEHGIVSSILGVKPFAKELGKATLKELPVEMGTEFGQGAGQALVEKDAGIRPDADWYKEGLQGAMAASMMTGGHMAGAGVGGAIKHSMTMASLTNPNTGPEARLRALEEVGQRIDSIDPAKGRFWRLNGVNAIQNNQPIPLDDTFLSDLTPRAIPVEDVNLLTGQQGAVPQLPWHGGNLPDIIQQPGGAGGGGGFTMTDPGYIDAEYEEIGPQGAIPGGQQRLAIPLLPNEQGGYENWLEQRGMQPQNLNPEDQAMLDEMVKARYGITPGLEGAHEAASSPLNDLPEPTEGQKGAGNYRKGHVNFQGLDISIENPAGSIRSGKDQDGKPWSTPIQHHYGYIKGTVGKDKDHIDTFIGNQTESDKVFVVDQINPKTGKFDEHKVMLGFDSQDAATLGYLRNYDDSGPSRIGAVTEMTVGDFKSWLKSGKTKSPVGLKPDASKAAMDRLSAITNGANISDRSTVSGYNEMRKRGGVTMAVDSASGNLLVDQNDVDDVNAAIAAGRHDVANAIMDRMEAGKAHETIHQHIFKDGQYQEGFAELAGQAESNPAVKEMMNLGVKHLLAIPEYRKQFEGYGAKLTGDTQNDVGAVLQNAGARTLALNELLAGHGNTRGAMTEKEHARYSEIRKDLLNKIGVDSKTADAGFVTNLDEEHNEWRHKRREGQDATKTETPGAGAVSYGRHRNERASSISARLSDKYGFRQGDDAMSRHDAFIRSEATPQMVADAKAAGLTEQAANPLGLYRVSNVIDELSDPETSTVDALIKNNAPESLGLMVDVINAGLGATMSNKGSARKLAERLVNWATNNQDVIDKVNSLHAEVAKKEEVKAEPQETAESSDDVTTKELTENGIKFDVNSKGEVIIMRDGKNTARKDKDSGTWEVYEGSLKKEDLVVDGVSMREAMDELVGMREPAEEEPGVTSTDSGNTATGEAKGGVEGEEEKPEKPVEPEPPKKPELTLEAVKKSKHWPKALKDAYQAAISLGKAKVNTIMPEKKADKMKPKGATWTPEEFEELLKAKAEDAAAKPTTVVEPQDMTREEYEAWVENHAFETVRDRLAHEEGQKEKETSRLGTLDNINTPELAMEFAQKLADVVEKGESLDKLKVLQMVADLYGTTVKEIREKLEAQEADWRHVEEAMEYAVVKYARAIASSPRTIEEKLAQLEKLYNAQPNLAKRDTNTKAGQQFSTPAPLAFLMGEAVGLSKQDKVYEPTAGNGMLVMGAAKSKVTVNEYDAVRRANLEDQGFHKVYGNDILDPSIPAGVSDRTQDAVLANPPFGKAEDERVFNDMPLTKKEHIIVADALDAMKNDGRAAFIIGGHNFKKGVMGEADWNFLNWLYKHYNVRHNIDINGDVYRKMGTTYPIRLIVVDGRKATPDEDYSVQDKEVNADKGALAMSEANSFEDVKKILEEKGYVDRRGQDTPVDDGGGLQGGQTEGIGGEPDDQRDAGVPPSADMGGDTGGSGRGENRKRTGSGPAGGSAGGNKRGSGKAPSNPDGKVEGGNKSRSTSELTGDIKTDINNALSHVDAAIKAVLKGITDPNKLSMGVTVDDKTYAEIKKHLAAAFEELKKAFKDFNELISKFAEQVIERYGAPIIPYASKFYEEVYAEHIANENKATEDKAEPGEGNELQAAYKPRSKGRSSNKLVPRNMEAFVRAALDDLEQRHGDIDEYVTSKLQYGSKEELYKALFADQIDTVAMAIDNIDRGLGFINGSQTGAGKGRTVAAIMWYAKTKGLKSIFFTQQPKLFSDMYRDLKGIGHPEMKPYIIHTKSEAHIYDSKSNIVMRAFPPGATSRSEEYVRVASNVEQELANYDTVFIPYSQINTANAQRDVLRALAPNSIIILDESHNAAGEDSNTGLFVQEILGLSPGVMYSSATFAKRPASMPIYFRTNLGQTGMSMEELIGAVEAGGVPLQQIISAQLARSGQYIRFEMDASQIASNEMTFSEDTKAEDAAASDAITSVMRDIVDFSDLFAGWVETVKDRMNVGKTKGNRVSVTTSSFSSVAHNSIAQLLLGLKVNMVADKAIEILKSDKKPLINLTNTMSSFIDDIAEMEGVKSGTELDITFVDALRRTLRNQLSYTVKPPGARRGNKVRIEPDQLSPTLRSMYDRILRKIDTTDVNLPASPIDMLRYRIEQAGYKVAEITGRNSRLDYSGDTPVYRSMSKQDKDRNAIVNGFNGGEIDCVIFNAAGSTGLSLHASEDFDDRRIRRMLIAQADLNIDTVMQAMGRIFRTGQVEKPEYEFTLTALPGEIRPAAILQRKLASMNANTSADAKNAYTNTDVPDMLNIYGDKVMAEYLLENADIGRLLHANVSRDDNGNIRFPEDFMRQMTGRMALLPVALQERVYKEIIEVYNAEIDYLNKTGQNRLIATVHDYNAKTLDSSMIYDGDENSPNPFTRPAYLEKILTKVTRKPHTIEEVRDMAEKELAGRSHREYVRDISKDITEHTRTYITALNRDLEEARANNNPTAAIERKIETIRENLSTFEELAANFVVGDPYTVVTASDGDSVFGVFLGVNFSKTAEGGNPMVPSKIGFKFAVANGERTITIPMSKHALLRQAEDERLEKLEQWDDMQKATTEVRYMVTGNLLTGYRSFVAAGRRPEVVMYSSDKGGTLPGIQVPKAMERELESLFRFTATDARTANDYLNHIKEINANNAFVTMTTGAPVVVMWGERAGKWRIKVDGSPQNNQAVMDRRLLGVTDAGRFDQNNGDWFAVVSPENLARALSVMESVFGAKFNVPREFMNRQGQEGTTNLSIGGVRRKLNPSSLSRIKSAIERILPPGVKLELAEKLEYDLDQVEAGAKAHGIDLAAIKASGKRYKIRARGSAQTIRLSTGELTSLIKLSMDMAGEETGYHEILHAAEALGIIKADDLKILERAFPEMKGKSSKEMRADAFGDYIVGKREKIPTPVQLVFQKIKRFLERLKNVLQGLGYRTAEDVFDDLFSGKLKRESGVRGVRQSELTAPYKAAEGQTEYSFVTDSLKAVERAIRDAQSTSKVASFATSAIDRAKEIAGRMGPLGALPEQNEYLAQRYRTLGNIDAGEELARKMHDALQKVSDEDAKAIYEFWTNPGMNVKQAGIKDVNAQKAALDVKKKIVDIGRELVERDLLDEKTYMENLGRYVPRVYLKHILGEQGFKAMGTGRKASVMAYLKQRKDIPEEVRRLLLGEIKDPAYLAARSISVPLRDMAILDWLGDIAKNGKWVLPESLVEWTFPANGKAKKVTPYWLMSEAKRLREQIHHMPEADRAEAKALADRMQSEGEAALAGIEGLVPDDYKQIPDSPRFGALRGMYVRKEIHQDLIGTTTIFAGDASIAEKFLGQGGVLTRYTQYWKWAKVAANPPAQARNFVSNLVLLHISGVPFHKVPTRIVEAIRQIRDNGKAWQIAKEYGVRKASFSNEEMARIERELIDLEAKRAGKGLGWPQMKSLAMKIVNMTGDWYQFMEAVGKTAKIIDMMERETIEYDHKEVVRTAAGTRTVTTKRMRKATAEEAAMAAHASLFDYSLVNPSVRYLRNAPIGIPFLTFLYKAVPMMAKNFAAHPTRMIPYLALSYGLTQLVSSMTGMDDDDLEALKKALPVWLQDKNHTYCLPFKDDRGRWQFVDLGYFFPWTAVADMAQNLGKGEFGKFLSTSGILGGPIPSLISAIQTNVDPFTKKQIIDKTATPSQQAGQLMGYLYQLNMPTWLTNNGVAGKMMQAMGNEVDKYGDPKATWAQAGLRMAGVNLYAVEPTRSRERNIKTMEGELTSLKREKTVELKNPKLTAADRADIIKEYGKELDKKKSEIDEYKKASQLSPAALS